jgi:hypothetical protein
VEILELQKVLELILPSLEMLIVISLHLCDSSSDDKGAHRLKPAAHIGRTAPRHGFKT